MPSFFRRIANIFSAPSQPLVRVKAPKDTRRWPDWISSGLTLDTLSSILRKADLGDMQDFMTLLQEISAREPLLNGLLSVRLSALSQRPIKVKPNTKDKDKERSLAVAAFVQETLDNLKVARSTDRGVEFYGGIKSVIESILMSVYYGASLGWVHYGEDAYSSIPKAIEFLDERRFYLDIQTDEMHIATDRNGQIGPSVKEFSPLQILETRNSRISKRLPMAGFGRSILLSWWLRFGTLKDLTNYVETWGRPGLVINAKDNDGAGYNESQYEELQDFLEDYLGDTRVLLPPGFEVKLLQAQNGGEKIFELVDKLTERHMQFAAVGQVGAIAGDSTTYAAGQQAQKVRDDLTDGDARLVGEALEKLARYAVSLRYGLDVPVPFIEFEVEKSIAAIKERAQAVQSAAYPLPALLKAGIPVDIREYCDTMGIPLTANGLIDPTYIENLKTIAQIIDVGTGIAPEEQPQETPQ